jgi:hypothetical protein
MVLGTEIFAELVDKIFLNTLLFEINIKTLVLYHPLSLCLTINYQTFFA